MKRSAKLTPRVGPKDRRIGNRVNPRHPIYTRDPLKAEQRASFITCDERLGERCKTQCQVCYEHDKRCSINS